MITLALLLLVPPIIRAIWDRNGVKANEYAEHNVWTAILFLLVSTILWKFLQWNYIATLFIIWSTYWLVFDFLLNKLRGFPVFQYYGDFTDEAHQSPVFEKYIYPNLSWKMILYCKITFFIASIALVIFL